MTRRADRLFQIVQILRGRRLTTAALLAERLGVSERTVYRDIRDLSQEKMLAILPEARRRQAEQTRLFAPDLGAHRYAKTFFDVIHQAVSGQQVLALRYQDESGRVTERDVLPLGLFFWGERWLLVAWCELRNDYRNFRLDRCLAVRATERRFSECAERSLNDFLRKVRCEVREK